MVCDPQYSEKAGSMLPPNQLLVLDILKKSPCFWLKKRETWHRIPKCQVYDIGLAPHEKKQTVLHSLPWHPHNHPRTGAPQQLLGFWVPEKNRKKKTLVIFDDMNLWFYANFEKSENYGIWISKMELMIRIHDKFIHTLPRLKHRSPTVGGSRLNDVPW